MNVGLGLWNHPVIALLLEAFLLFGALVVYMQRTAAVDAIGRFGPVVLGIVMLVIQCYVFFGPPPTSPNAAALTALAACAVFAALAIGLDRRRHSVTGRPSGARE